MTAVSVDPRARLHWIRNVHKGLMARSNIIRRLERQDWNSVQDLAYDVNLAAATVLYHLHNMHREDIVEKEPQGRRWRMSTRFQTSLADYLRPTALAKQKDDRRPKKADATKRNRPRPSVGSRPSGR